MRVRISRGSLPIEASKYCSKAGETRACLTMVCLQFEGKDLKVIATDGRVLFLLPMIDVVEIDGDKTRFSVCIAKKWYDKMARENKDKSVFLELTFPEEWVENECLIVGEDGKQNGDRTTYPDFRRIIPTTSKYDWKWDINVKKREKYDVEVTTINPFKKKLLVEETVLGDITKGKSQYCININRDYWDLIMETFRKMNYSYAMMYVYGQLSPIVFTVDYLDNGIKIVLMPVKVR